MPQFRTIGCLLIAMLAFTGALQARPELHNVSLNVGSSPRMNRESWAYFNFRLKNPDDTPARILLTLQPKEQRNITVFTQMIDLAPHTDLRYRMLVTIGSVEDYVAELYVNGNKLESEDAVIRISSETDRQIVFVNDSVDLDYGNFAKNTNLKARYLSITQRADALPTHWVGYDRAWILVLMRPNYDAMSQRQFDAILDFAARGGTVLFDDPTGIEQAMQTPLAALLNIQVLRVRKLERLTGHTVFGGTPIEWPEGEDFLECVPLEGGEVTAKQGDFPLVYWSRYGLGTVGLCTINPSQRGFRKPDETNFNAMWLHFLSRGGQVSYPSSTKDYNITKAIDTLTGIRIPSRAFVRNLLLAFLAVIVLSVGIGVATRRQIVAWVALAALSLSATLSIFVYANIRDRDLPDRNATVLDFRVYGPSRDTGDQITSLFTKRESTEVLHRVSPEVVIRSLTPVARPTTATDDLIKAATEMGNTRANGPGRPSEDDAGSGAKSRVNPLVNDGKGEIMRDPLTITRSEGMFGVDTLLLKYKAPRFFSTLYSTATHANTPDQVLGQPLPVVQWTGNLPNFTTPWKVPESIKATSAVLFMEAGSLPVVIRNGLCEIVPPSREILGQAADVQALEAFIRASRSPSPMLALFSSAHDDAGGMLDGSFTVDGQRIHLIPVVQELKPGSISLPWQRFRIDAFQGQGRMLMNDGVWTSVAPVKGSGPDREFEVAAFTPPRFSGMALQTLHVTFEADNRGRNLNFALFLRFPNDNKGKHDIAATRSADNVYTFENLPSGLLDPRDGQLNVVVKESQIQKVIDPTAAFRLNTWTIREFKVAASGEMPQEHAGTY